MPSAVTTAGEGAPPPQSTPVSVVEVVYPASGAPPVVESVIVIALAEPLEARRRAKRPRILVADAGAILRLIICWIGSLKLSRAVSACLLCSGVTVY